MFFRLLAFGLVGLASCEPSPENTISPRPKLGANPPAPAIESHAGQALRSPQEYGGIRFLSEPEIRALMGTAGRVTIFPYAADDQEIFYPDGRYLHLGRAPFEGRYSLEAGRICIGHDLNTTSCRAVFMTSAGEVRISAHEDPTWGSRALTFSPVSPEKY